MSHWGEEDAGIPTESGRPSQMGGETAERHSENPQVQTRPCRRCRGSGEDPDAHHRYTTGGKDDRRCRQCNGDGVIGLQ